MFFEEELRAKIPWEPLRGHFLLSIEHKLLYKIDPWCSLELNYALIDPT
jgi:hypothetical protein